MNKTHSSNGKNCNFPAHKKQYFISYFCSENKKLNDFFRIIGFLFGRNLKNLVFLGAKISKSRIFWRKCFENKVFFRAKFEKSRIFGAKISKLRFYGANFMSKVYFGMRWKVAFYPTVNCSIDWKHSWKEFLKLPSKSWRFTWTPQLLLHWN